MPRPDLILYNGRIYRDAQPGSRVEALAVWKGRVADSGSSREILRLKSRATKAINLQGRVVLPGLSDSHIHLLNYGMLLRQLDLTKTRSIEEIKQRVSRAAVSSSKDDWILGRGWDDEKLEEKRYPCRADLDGLPSNPVFLKRVCGHAAVANSAALAIAGISTASPDPEGGLILRDSNGEPSGVLKERAIELVETKIPQSREETRKSLVVASRRLVGLGLTSLHCIISNLVEFRTLQELKRKGTIPQSIYAVIPVGLLDQLTTLGFATQHGTDAFRIGGVKLFLDGSLGAHTAALNSPYTDDTSCSGMLTMSREELETVARKARDEQFQLCLHAIGDKAIDLAVETVQNTFGMKGSPAYRHRIEHASLLLKKSMQKMSRLGIVASIQPRFIYSDSWARSRLGPDRLKLLYPFASTIKSGVTLAAGSDGPVEDPNPFEGIWSAITRPGLDSKERLTVSEAIASYTTGAAYASFSEDARGTLDSGKFADLVVVDRDPFESTPEEVRRTRVLTTVIQGVVYS